MDSDDYFVERDFIADRNIVFGQDSLYYCDMTTGFGNTKFPDLVIPSNYFNFILHRHEGICNTSSMCFSSHLKLRFDSDLPRHQDWDFVYRNFISKGLALKRVGGLVFIDRGDVNSVSRKRCMNNSIPWLMKMRNNLPENQFALLRFHLLCSYKAAYSWGCFFSLSFKYFFQKSLSLRVFSKRLLQRLVSK